MPPLEQQPLGLEVPSAAPTLRARILSFSAILIAGACGGLVGHSVTELQCQNGCATLSGIVGVGAALFAAIGVGVVTVLVLRAMAEWQTSSRQITARDRHPTR